ncbi:hypothetical protein D2T29_21350 [Sinirhodobacter populi]|uniref:IclR family transcriptional regulator n=1 Tax=Paenirhodobacter populi TaxID=2306993 RepID=A0A443K023_9RHOB|nr:hypothetical protein D2T29_21350 [Sinirhodobacter populi]
MHYLDQLPGVGIRLGREQLSKIQAPISSLSKASAILELFGPGSPKLRISELSALSGLNRSSVQRITHTLARCGWLERSEESGLFSLGYRCLGPANTYFESNGWLALVMPFLARFNRETGLNCDCWLIDGDEAITVGRTPSAVAAMSLTPLGSRLPLTRFAEAEASALSSGPCAQPVRMLARRFRGADGQPLGLITMSGHIDMAAIEHYRGMLRETVVQIEELHIIKRVLPSATIEPMQQRLVRISDDDPDPLLIGAVARALYLLQFFTPVTPELSLTELAHRSGLPVPTVQRMTQSLVEMEYLEKDPQTRSYHVALKSLDLLYRFQISSDLVNAIWPTLVRLRAALGLRCSFCILDETEIMHLLHIQSLPHPTFRTAYPGRRLPAVSSSGGRAILSRLPEERLRDIIERSPIEAATDMTVTDKEEILAEIRLSRDRGYALTDRQSIAGEVNIAAAVAGADGTPLGAVVISSPVHSWNIARLEREVAPILLDETWNAQMC